MHTTQWEKKITQNCICLPSVLFDAVNIAGGGGGGIKSSNDLLCSVNNNNNDNNEY